MLSFIINSILSRARLSSIKNLKISSLKISHHYKKQIMELIINILLWLFKPKDLITVSNWLHYSKIGKNVNKVFVTGILIFFIFVHLSIFALTLAKYNFSVNGFYIASVITTISLIITFLYFYFTFKDLFFPKNNTNQKPFTIV